MPRKSCGHGRDPLACPYCTARIRVADFWDMMRWRKELRRKRPTRKAPA
jgi:hypothetical protein